MIIDFHAHCWEGKGDIKDFLLHMDKYHIDISVLHAIDEPGYSSNEYVANLIKQYPDRLMGFACVHPHECFAAKRLRMLLDTYGFSGLKLPPRFRDFQCRIPRSIPLSRSVLTMIFLSYFTQDPLIRKITIAAMETPGLWMNWLCVTLRQKLLLPTEIHSA